MMKSTVQLYRTPFSPAYWRQSSKSMGDLRMLVFAALMIAMARALSMLPSIPVGHTKITFGFLARALCALVCGPVTALAYGFAEDILGFILKPTGDFFFGYTLSTMLGVMVYALFLYRSRVTVLRLVAANAVVNIGVNAALGSLWTMMMRGGGYWGWFIGSLSKNLVTIIPKAVLLYLLFQALLPILQQMKLIPRQLNDKGRISWI